MAFENINVTSLKNALLQCKNSIDYSTTDEVIQNISSSTVWQSDTKNKLRETLGRLKNEKYKDLENLLNDYLYAVSYIDEYQELERENKSLEIEYSNLQDRLYYTEEYTTSTTSSDGTVETETHTRTVKDYSVELKMNNVRETINNNNEKMSYLENKVSNLI